MSAQDPSSLSEWYQNLPIPWLVGGPNGRAEATALGAILDRQVTLIKLATKARFPGYAPTDALPHIGGDRQLEQGPSETNANFVTRLKTAWDDWANAGTVIELLVQLYWAGFGGAVIIQQNGVAYQLSGAPVAGADPHALLVESSTSALAISLHSDRTLTRSIPAGTPWWTIDSDTDHCSRFDVLYPTSSPFLQTTGTATFTGVEDGSALNPWPVATWSNMFPNTSYCMRASLPNISDGNGLVAVAPDATKKTTTGCAVASSAPFVGTVDVLAYQAGSQNPWCDPHPGEFARLQRIIARWKPGKALCRGVFALTQGNFVGWPVRLAGAAAPSTSVVTQIGGNF